MGARSSGNWPDCTARTLIKLSLDYGCGPGNDLAGFAEFSGAREIIGVDISRRALDMARARVSWHTKPGQAFRFIQVADLKAMLPIETAYVDYIQSLGVLMCTSDCVQILDRAGPRPETGRRNQDHAL